MYKYTKAIPATGLDSPLGLQEVEVPRISRQSTNEGGKVSRTHWPALPTKEVLLVLIYVRA